MQSSSVVIDKHIHVYNPPTNIALCYIFYIVQMTHHNKLVIYKIVLNNLLILSTCSHEVAIFEVCATKVITCKEFILKISVLK